MVQKYKNKSETASEIEENNSQSSKKGSETFYQPDPKFKGKIKILYKPFNDQLEKLGFRLFVKTKPYVYILNNDNVIKEVSIAEIQKKFFDYINNEIKANSTVKTTLLETFYKNISHYFNDGRLSLLWQDQPIEFVVDNEKQCFLYFKNGYVAISNKTIDFQDYNKLKGCIWEHQKNQRDFRLLDWQINDSFQRSDFGDFGNFMFNISGSPERFMSLCTIIGYLIHNCYDIKRKAVVFTDSKISDRADGRTGKTLLCQSLGNIIPTVIINGKDFDSANKHKYSMVNRGTQFVTLNDVKRGFDVEAIFNDVTDGIEVDKKNQQPFKIHCKMAIATNKTLRIEGSSAKDRFIEFELTEHYSKDYSPEMEFGRRFFSGWDADEWNRFDNLMCFCVMLFLKKGMIEPIPINLGKRKVVDITSFEFVTWLDDCFKENRIEFNKELDLNNVFTLFFESYPEFKDNKKYSDTRNKKRFLEA